MIIIVVIIKVKFTMSADVPSSSNALNATRVALDEFVRVYIEFLEARESIRAEKRERRRAAVVRARRAPGSNVRNDQMRRVLVRQRASRNLLTDLARSRLTVDVNAPPIDPPLEQAPPTPPPMSPDSTQQ